MTRVDPTGRRRAREAALQMLYQSEVGRMGPQEAIGAYWRIDRSATTVGEDGTADEIADEIRDDLRAFANELVRETLARVDAIDQCWSRTRTTGGSSGWR